MSDVDHQWDRYSSCNWENVSDMPDRKIELFYNYVNDNNLWS